jgi:hypothetical protein
MVMEAAKWLNFFPSKNGVSEYYSPRVILHQRGLDFNKHCKYLFGSYIQPHNDPYPKNTNSPRTIDCIYLRYFDNFQGGHELYNLNTRQIIKRQHVTELPMNDEIIKKVEEIGKAEKMPLGLLINSKSNHNQNIDKLAGVEEHYTDEQDKLLLREDNLFQEDIGDHHNRIDEELSSDEFD